MEDVLTPEEYALLLSLGTDNQQLSDAIKMQMHQAEQLRAEAPQMRRAGRVVMAPTAMELLGGLAQNKSSYDLQRGALENQKRSAATTNQQNQMMMQALLRGRQPQQAAPTPAPYTGWPNATDNNGAY
jgi:chaperonin cofactor prefoldin